MISRGSGRHVNFVSFEREGLWLHVALLVVKRTFELVRKKAFQF